VVEGGVLRASAMNSSTRALTRAWIPVTMSGLGAGVNLCTKQLAVRTHARSKYMVSQAGVPVGGDQDQETQAHHWVITSGVFQSMDALRFGIAAAAWLIRGQNWAAIRAPWAEAGCVLLSAHLVFGVCRPGPLLPGGSIGFRKGLGDCLPEGGLGGAWDDPGGGHLLQIYNWMRCPRWFVRPRRWPGIPPFGLEEGSGIQVSFFFQGCAQLIGV
jgi:hypothetical protein